ncbi:MAG: PLP-dependent aminotransferase family protein [Clostridiales bacterium]|nr:PLP-dependent aminotransferase family protein [Clostridiales bacterium]
MDIQNIRFASRFNGISGSAIREIFKLLAVPGMISFAGGNPAANALPDGQCADLAKELLLDKGKVLLQYGATEGYAPLRESLAPYVKDRFSFSCAPDEILPVTGSTQAMDLLCKALIDPGDKIAVESPTFLGNMQCMRLYQAQLLPVESDADGIRVDLLEEVFKKEHPKMLYVIPTFQNPTGRTLSLERRKKIAALAAEYGVVVAEDDPYRDLRYAGTELPSIKSFDTEGWVAFLGSFSKVISPGLRVGFLCANANLLRKCIIGKQSTDVHTANLNQAIVDAYLRRGLLMPHVERICQSYREQMNTMLGLLAKCGGVARYTKPEGGLFIFAELNEGMDAAALLKSCVDRGVAYVPGTYFYPAGGHPNTIRLNFSMCTVDQIKAGMQKLDSVFSAQAK